MKTLIMVVMLAVLAGCVSVGPGVGAAADPAAGVGAEVSAGGSVGAGAGR